MIEILIVPYQFLVDFETTHLLLSLYTNDLIFNLRVLSVEKPDLDVEIFRLSIKHCNWTSTISSEKEILTEIY